MNTEEMTWDQLYAAGWREIKWPLSCPRCEAPLEEALSYANQAGQFVVYCPPCDRDVEPILRTQD